MMLPDANALWSALPVPALLIDAQDLITAVNPAAEEFLNLSARALLGQGLLDRITIDAPMAAALARARAGHSALFLEDVAVGLTGRAPKACNLQAGPLADASGTVLLLITPRDPARLVAEARGQGAGRSVIGLAEMLAHEIKNPLAGISGAAQLLAMGLPPEDQELTDLIVEETRRVVKLLEQVEQFGDLRPPDLRAINIHDVLARARRGAELGFASLMRFEEDFDPSLPQALADPDQLLQALQNLLKNAAQAAGASGGTIRLRSYYDRALRVRLADGSDQPLPLQIEVIDDGPGIPDTIAGDVFAPFVSGRENGTGLGLALVSKIVTAHSGWVTVETRPGHTLFRLSLPLAPPDLNQKD